MLAMDQGPQIEAKIDLSGTAENFLIDAPANGGNQMRRIKVGMPTGAKGSWDKDVLLYDLYGDGHMEPAPKIPANRFGSTSVVGKFLQDSKGLQAVFWHGFDSTTATAYMEMVSYEEKGHEPRVVWRSSPLESGVFETLTLAIDANNDGQLHAAAAHLRELLPVCGLCQPELWNAAEVPHLHDPDMDVPWRECHVGQHVHPLG